MKCARRISPHDSTFSSNIGFACIPPLQGFCFCGLQGPRALPGTTIYRPFRALRSLHLRVQFATHECTALQSTHSPRSSIVVILKAHEMRLKNLTTRFNLFNKTLESHVSRPYRASAFVVSKDPGRCPGLQYIALSGLYVHCI